MTTDARFVRSHAKWRRMDPVRLPCAATCSCLGRTRCPRIRWN